jgi:tetratricopeptide (TPR) repeat protein
MDQKGQDEIRQAQQLAAAHNYEKAFNQYLGVARRFRGLSCAGTAAKEYAALKNNPEVAAQIKKDRAASLLKRAEDALARKEYLNAVALFETLVQAYGDLQEAQTAKSRLETLQADKELWASILAQRAEAEARSLLSLATSYITMGMREKAVPRLQELIQKYPDGEQAKAARELLGDEPITTRPAS